MSKVDIAALRATLGARERTHWDRCYLMRTHKDCAIARLLREVEELQDEVCALRGDPACVVKKICKGFLT